MKDKRFPLIAEFNHLDFAVCFTSEKTGIVVFSRDDSHPLGEFSDGWISCYSKDNWCIIAEPSEYPKEMYVSDINKSHAINNHRKENIIFFNNDIGYLDEDGVFWKYAIDIPEQEEKKGVDLCGIKNHSFPYGGKKEEINTFESSQRLRRRNIFDEEFFSVLESRMKEFQDILNELKPKL